MQLIDLVTRCLSMVFRSMLSDFIFIIISINVVSVRYCLKKKLWIPAILCCHCMFKKHFLCLFANICQINWLLCACANDNSLNVDPNGCEVSIFLNLGTIKLCKLFYLLLLYLIIRKKKQISVEFYTENFTLQVIMNDPYRIKKIWYCTIGVWPFLDAFSPSKVITLDCKMYFFRIWMKSNTCFLLSMFLYFKTFESL